MTTGEASRPASLLRYSRSPFCHSRLSPLSFPLSPLSFPPLPSVIPASPLCHSRLSLLSFLPLPSVIPASPLCHSRLSSLSFPPVVSGNPVSFLCPFIRVSLRGENPMDSRLKTSGMTEGGLKTSGAFNVCKSPCYSVQKSLLQLEPGHRRAGRSNQDRRSLP